MSSSSPLALPAPASNQTYLTISALDSGHLTLPEHLFITSADPDKRTTVPSLSFLIRHPTATIVFDLGVSRDINTYALAMQTHISNRQPTIHHPDTAASLRLGNLDPTTDIDIVMLSHVHWDHVGTPSDFPNSRFVVGSGTLHLLENGAPPNYPKEIFDPNLLPRERTRELPPTEPHSTTAASAQTSHTWKPLASFPATADFFGDGSLFVVDAPGHLFGHINLLCRTGPKKWVYLGGDCCHDVRILTGEKGIAMYDDGHGGLRSVHVDTEKAKGTVERIRPLLKAGEVVEEGGEKVRVEVIVAHDREWREGNRGRFLPGTL